EWARDRADRVHGALDAEGAAKLSRCDRTGEQTVAGGSLAASGDPRDRARYRDDGPREREAERAVTDCGDGVCACSEFRSVEPGRSAATCGCRKTRSGC